MRTLSAQSLVKRYKQNTIVNGVDLKVNDTEVVGLLGANGAGKTTSFNMIIGLVRESEGNIYLDDDDITELPMHERARLGIGYLPQEHSVFRKLTSEENILAVLETTGKYDANERAEISKTLLEEFGIYRLRDKQTIQLSGGEQRRVEIARALALEPSFILLDEPFAGVDPIAVSEMQDIIANLRDRQMGILITDHNFRETLAITDRAYVMRDGQILASGTAEELYENSLVKQYYLGDKFQK